MENSEEVNSNPKRPTFLLVLCILSFISTGFNLIGNIVNLLKGPLSQDELNVVLQEMQQLSDMVNQSGSGFTELFEKLAKITQFTNDNFYMHEFILIASFALGFYGVLKMYQGIKNGFHLYIIYNLLSISSIYVSVPPSDVPSFIVIFSVIFSGIFIFMYSRNLHWMK
ncbi:MAG: hypothetical protein HYU67_02635 [Flavobacteriia bacterium]|nr:hypothetical protein [Flavobacteriia bacterium]